jgi:peroxiredoxin (alkyl hydroperoxide reductase subunit C)
MEEKVTTEIPRLGDKFPEMDVHTTKGPISIPKDTLGKWMVFFSHPADFTPVCTTELVAFAKLYDEFQKLNAELIGLSIDQIFSHINWVEWIKSDLGVEIPFPIVADDRGLAAEKLGMIHPKKGLNTVRAVFIVDPDSNIRLILSYPPEIGRHVKEILRALRALQVADEHSVSTPESWPHNELIGCKVLNPPPKDIKSAEKSINNKDGYDWWFTYKKLNLK